MQQPPNMKGQPTDKSQQRRTTAHEAANTNHLMSNWLYFCFPFPLMQQSASTSPLSPRGPPRHPLSSPRHPLDIPSRPFDRLAKVVADMPAGITVGLNISLSVPPNMSHVQCLSSRSDSTRRQNRVCLPFCKSLAIGSPRLRTLGALVLLEGL